MFVEIPASKKSLAYRSPIHGVGINDADYIVQPQVNGKRYPCPFYSIWKAMITRCYCPIYLKKRPTYIGCTVGDPWLTFTTFKSWMINQDWHNKELDKDILLVGNKEYREGNCAFVNRELNALIKGSYIKSSGLPRGVSTSKKGYRVRAGLGQKKVSLGTYQTVMEASNVYEAYRSTRLTELAEKESDKLREAILLHANTRILV